MPVTVDEYNTTSLRPSRRSIIVDRDYLAHVLRWSYVTKLIARRSTDDRPYVILDIGCGIEAPLPAVIAYHSYLARGRPIEYHGVDVGPITPLVERPWTTFYPNTDALEWDPGTRGDLVVCFETIEHMPRDRGIALLRRLRHLVRPDGLVLLSTPVRSGDRMPRNHVYEWSLTDLMSACLSAGLDPTSVYGTFMDVDTVARLSRENPALREVWGRLSHYYCNEVLSCLFAPLFPFHAKSVFLSLSPV